MADILKQELQILNERGLKAFYRACANNLPILR